MSGVRLVGRSFKYHRQRGLLCMTGNCPNCLVTVDGTPNVRSCKTPVEEGMLVTSQNAWPSLDTDAMSMVQLAGRFLPVGFYYKAFMRPRQLWPLYEKVLRGAQAAEQCSFNDRDNKRRLCSHYGSHTAHVRGDRHYPAGK